MKCSASSVAVAKSKSGTPLIFDKYDPNSNPSELSPLLDDLLLPQYVDVSSARGPDSVVDDIAGHSFQVSRVLLVCSFMSFFPLMCLTVNCL